MTTFNKQIIIKTSQQKVWEIVSDLGSIYKFNPGVRNSYYSTKKTEGVGAARICELQPAGKIIETVTNWNEGSGFSLQIEPIEKAPPVKNFKGLFELKELEDKSTEVAVTIAYDMKLGAIGLLLNNLVIQSKMEKGIEDLLSGLKVHAETSIEIKNIKALHRITKAE